MRVAFFFVAFFLPVFFLAVFLRAGASRIGAFFFAFAMVSFFDDQLDAAAGLGFSDDYDAEDLSVLERDHLDDVLVYDLFRESL